MNARTTLVAVLGILCLCAHAAAQPNNSCQFAQDIAGPGVFGFDNGFATADGFPDPCGNYDRDVWYHWTADADGQVNLFTCGLTAVNTKVSVLFAGPCPGGNGPVACNDDACGAQSAVQWGAVAGESFLIRIGTPPGEAGGPGAFEIQVKGAPQDCNNNGQPDDIDIARGVSLDNNVNGMPDECEGNVEFEQVSWKDEGGGFAQRYSDFGTLKVTVVQPRSDQILWLNAEVNGEWVVQNAPIVTMTSVAELHQYEVGFDLRNVPGVEVNGLVASVEVTANQSATGTTTPPLPFIVNEAPQHIGLRIGEFDPPTPVVPTDPVDFINPFTGIVLWESVTRPGVPGVQEENNHCAPGAVSRSLAWMNDEYCLGFPANCDSTAELYNKLKDAMHMMTSAATGTTDPKIVSGSQQLIMEKGLAGSLTVTLDLTKTPEDALNALKAGKDVMGLICYTGRGGHIYTITGVTKCLGEYTIHYRDDEDQGDDSDGDEGTKDSKYDGNTGTLSGFGAGANWDGLVIICPSPAVQINAWAKWMFGDGVVTDGILAALDDALDGGAAIDEAFVDAAMRDACNAAETAVAIGEAVQTHSAPVPARLAAVRVLGGAGVAKLRIEEFKLSFLAGMPDLALLLEAQLAYGDQSDNKETLERWLACPADRDGDGDVDVDDLVAVITDWGCSEPICDGDANGDGTTDVNDLVDVITTWGPCPPPTP